MKSKNIITIPLILGILVVGFSIFYKIEKSKASTNQKESVIDFSTIRVKKKPVSLDSLSPSTLLAYSKINSCYLPLVKDSSFFCVPREKGFDISELYNDTLGTKHKFANRYLVADLMVLDDKMQPRGIKEVHPELKGIFHRGTQDSVFINSLLTMEREGFSQEEFKEYLNRKYPSRADEIFNFYTKVWQYLTPPLEKKYTYYNNKVYAAGQKICLCEINGDTIEQVAQFAVSAKKFGSVNSIYIPSGNKRDYYASQYTITSKCWERARKYEELDMKHDQQLGGGKKEVTFYKGGVELPNFLLMNPTKEFPEAVKMNGIHQLALRELSMASLGSPNSLGCLRVSKFGSRFIRWWTPKFANLFVVYQDERYYKKYDTDEVKIAPPFENSSEGNKFRKWLCNTMPEKAIQLNIDSTGDYKNGHILYAYNVYGRLYESRYDSLQQSKKQNLQHIAIETQFPVSEIPKESIAHKLIRTPSREGSIDEEKNKINKKYKLPGNSNSVMESKINKNSKMLIILGSFRNENNAINFKKSLIDEGHRNVELLIKNSLYRVAIVEENSEDRISHRLQLFRAKYPDAWMVCL